MKLKKILLSVFNAIVLRKKLYIVLEKMLINNDNYDKGYSVIVFIKNLPTETIYYYLCNCDGVQQLPPLLMLSELNLAELNWIQLVAIRNRCKFFAHYYEVNNVLQKMCAKITDILRDVKPDYA